MSVRGVAVWLPQAFRGAEADAEEIRERCEGLDGGLFEEAETGVSGGRGKEEDYVEGHQVDPGPSPPDVLSGFCED